jgi:hypothetical protein
VGGKARGDAYRALPATEQARILVKLAIGRERWKARRDGLPPPVIMLGEAEPDAGMLRAAIGCGTDQLEF